MPLIVGFLRTYKARQMALAFGLFFGLILLKEFAQILLDEKPQVVSGQTPLGELVQKINQMRVPFVGPYKYEEIPLSEAFPLEECFKEFGVVYFTNTICFMIFYALLHGAKE